MEFRDLKTQYLMHRMIIDEALSRAILETKYIGGPQVGEVEKMLAAYVGVKHCISCGNGTDALQLALMAWDIGPGDVVFVPDFTFFSSGEVVSAVGAVPVFVDIREDTFNIDCDSLKHAVQYIENQTDLKPKAVIPVDLFGLPADHDRVREIAKKHQMLILEDGAQGFGGMIGERKACSFGDISTTSFFPAKPLGCYGDGGAVFTDNDEWAEKIRSLKVHGKGKDKYDNIQIGMNSRLDTLQAAVIKEKMSFFEEEIYECNKVAGWYEQVLKDCRVKTPQIPKGYRSSWAQYTILLENKKEREEVMEKLRKNDIPSMIYYKKPMHMQKAFEGQLVYRSEISCKVTESICERCLSLPMSAYVTRVEIEKIAGCL